jgi:hypothetical protein
MLLHNKVAEQIEMQDAILSGDAVSDAWRIEEVLNRAHEIHRAHGGLFGYDLEDWLEAERELAERNRAESVRVIEISRSEPLPWDEERNCQKCFGLNN